MLSNDLGCILQVIANHPEMHVTVNLTYTCLLCFKVKDSVYPVCNPRSIFVESKCYVCVP
jgi:hypothetical protein